MIEKYERIIGEIANFSDFIYNKYENEIKDNLVLGKDALSIQTGKLNANQATDKGEYPFYTCGKDVLKIDNYSFDGDSIILAGNGEISVKYYDGKFDAYQRTYVIKTNSFFFLFLKEFEKRVDEFKNGSQGSVIKFITKSMIENVNIETNENSNTFNNNLKLLYKLKINYQKNISTLQKIKSTLLSKYF
ncbi:hypothetical protein [Mycoplasma procyoni]|uniref:hypothetical protein n=1 Tax=Mycoplasma procyoni TaxID=568784 RepID=UPI00197C3C87|nr:hypothetical protein [Mycoplasma procyoni]MBN3534506.1 hypothetical protein [Mycoplasma procyoni]